MRIAILGTRGIPANYGGFETFAEELSKRLVERGHDVAVYCRSHHVDRDLKQFNGVRLRVLPTIRHKYLDTVLHTFLSAIDAITKRFDVVLVCNAANSPLIPILTWTGTPVAVNVDGLERKRKKWNWLGRMYYRLGEKASVWFATKVVTDARVISDYYQSEYGIETTYIAYGAEVAREANGDALRQYGLEPERYLLYLSRLEPENNADMVIEAFKNVATELKLAIVGDAPYAAAYISELKRLAAGDPRIVFTGFVFGEDRKALQQNAYAYVHATEVGGTHPALIEAMGAGNCVLSYDTPENREVMGSAGVYYSSRAELSAKLQELIDEPNSLERYQAMAREHVSREYDWETVTDSYVDLFVSLARGK